MLELVRPDVRYRESYLAAVAEYHELLARTRPQATRETAYLESRFMDGDIGWLYDGDNFATFVARLRADSEPTSPRPPGWSPSTYLWLVDGEKFLGTLDIRHQLTPFLLEVGGSIGYDIRPSARSRGLGTQQLRLALPAANALGFDPVLVTCDTDNYPSRRVIEANGGALEDVRGDKCRYWVPTSRGA
jgi:predicted acetyltransferase